MKEKINNQTFESIRPIDKPSNCDITMMRLGKDSKGNRNALIQLGYRFEDPKIIYYQDGLLGGRYYLQKPLDQMTDNDLRDFFLYYGTLNVPKKAIRQVWKEARKGKKDDLVTSYYQHAKELSKNNKINKGYQS